MLLSVPTSPRLLVNTKIPASPTSPKAPPLYLRLQPPCLSSSAYNYTTNENYETGRPQSPCYDHDQKLTFSSPPPPPLTLYDILGIQMSATNEEIKAAYRRLVRVYHPDVVVREKKDASADEFMKINSAYSTLLDPFKRANYDQKLTRQLQRPLGSTSQFGPLGSPSASSSMSGFSGYNSRRNWETDQCW